MTVIANNGASVQMILPNFMRARGMAVHQMVFFGAMVVGSLLWGKIANLLERAGRADRLGGSRCVPLTVLAASIRLPRLDDATQPEATCGSMCSFQHKSPKNLPAGAESSCNRVD